LALPNVTLMDECDVEGPATTEDRRRVTGVYVIQRGAGHQATTLPADLVVDASGRGSASPKWLEQLGYSRPEEETVQINISYATRIYRRKPGDLVEAKLLIISPEPPENSRGGFLFPLEEDRWIVSLGGRGDDNPPTDESGFLAYARSLAAPDLAQMLPRLEPLSDIYAYRFPANLRRRYEKVAHFPDGYLVLGDAVCSFNPIYGQGMTSAALQAVELDRLLQSRGAQGVTGLAAPYFKRVAKIVDSPWQMAVGQDFRFPTTVGEKSPKTDFINSYVARVNRATHHDPVVYRAFLDVMNMIKPPTSLMAPKIMARVMWPARRGRHQASAAQSQPA
jgi:2-polyprenyl-6-methoxyphenol hydroxylase-like FAD-dependent oxidoreductase